MSHVDTEAQGATHLTADRPSTVDMMPVDDVEARQLGVTGNVASRIQGAWNQTSSRSEEAHVTVPAHPDFTTPPLVTVEQTVTITMEVDAHHANRTPVNAVPTAGNARGESLTPSVTTSSTAHQV